jgi:hypothetical protein
VCRSLRLMVTQPCSPGPNGNLVEGRSWGHGRWSLVAGRWLALHCCTCASTTPPRRSATCLRCLSLHCTCALSLHCTLIALRPYPFLPPFGALRHRLQSFWGPGARPSSSCRLISPYNVRVWWTGVGRSIHADVARGHVGGDPRLLSSRTRHRRHFDPLRRMVSCSRRGREER